MLKHKICIILALGLILGACQKTESPHHSPDQASAVIHTAGTSEVVIPTSPSVCAEISPNFAELEKSWSPQKLMQQNTHLETCLKDASVKQRYQWLDQSEKTYKEFLGHIPASVQAYLTGQEASGETLGKAKAGQLYQQFNTNEKYLADHYKTLYLDKFYLGEGEYALTERPAFYAEVYGPYLEKADQIYLKQLNQEYTGKNYILDAGLSISFNEVAERLIFWENFYRQYPHSHFIENVKDFIQAYRHALFQGDDNTRVLWFHEQEFADQEALKAIQKVADSEIRSAPTAQKILSFIKEKEPEWKQLPRPTDSDADYDTPENQDIIQQREAFMQNMQNTIDGWIEQTPV